MLRILFLTGSLAHGGAERHSVSLMNGLSGRGHECHVVYVKRDGDLVEHIRLASGGSVHCLDATRYFDWRALLDLARHVNHIRPHAIVAVNSYALMYAALALRLVRQRVCLVVTYHSTRLTSLRERLQMMAYRPMFWTADRLIFVCVAQMRHCIRRAVFARANEVIHNGVDVMHFRSSGDKQARGRLRAAFGFLDSDFVIGLPALLRAEKNHIQLVDAVAALRHAGIPARVLMIGDGPMRARIEARARERAVERHVAITGLQRDVRPYIAACDVVAVCSITEAFSMAAIEAMALGKAVVHSQVGGAAEMIYPGHNGFLFPVGDTDALVDRLSRLAAPGVAQDMGENARRVAERLFSDGSMIDRYEQVLLESCSAFSWTTADGIQ